MKRMNQLLLLVAIIVVFGAGGKAVAQTDNLFLPPLGSWDNDANWSSGAEPTATQNAIIPAGKTCYIEVDDPDAVAQKITVPGTLQVRRGAVLTITDDSSVDAIDGRIEVSGTITIADDLTLSGTGEVHMKRGTTPTTFDSKLDGTGELTLTTAIKGVGDIDLTLINNGIVEAGLDGESGTQALTVEGTLSGSGRWSAAHNHNLIILSPVSGSAQWYLAGGSDEGHHGANRIQIDACCAVTGNVHIGQGELWVDAGSFCTTGQISILSTDTQWSRIVVSAGRSAAFDAKTCSICN